MKDSLRWTRVNRQDRCTVCRKDSGCLKSRTTGDVVCIRVASTEAVPWGLQGWVHRSDEPINAAELQPLLAPNRRKASPEVLDRTYRFFLEQHSLNSAHQEHLHTVRKLRVDQVRQLGYVSWGMQKDLRRLMARQACELLGQVVLDVPGVLLRNQTLKENFRVDRDYLTLGGPSGLLIPVRDVKRRVIAAQIRPDDQKKGKYVWLSSASRGGASSGTPVHVAQPQPAPASRRVWITEGPLKADIAMLHLNEIVLAIAGVSADRELLPTLEQLRERGQVDQVVLALDMDFQENPAVARARKKLAEKLSRAGFPVSLAHWSPRLKGLDDLLLAGGKPRFKPHRVHGSGPRPFWNVEAESAAPARPKTMTLDEARTLQERGLRDFLFNRKGENGELGLLVRSQPGAGKSHALIASIKKLQERHRRRSVAVFAPRHGMFPVAELPGWTEVRGRTHRRPGSQSSTPCSFPDRQEKLAGLRISAQIGCERCPLLANCRATQKEGQGNPFYHGQFHSGAKVTVFPAQHFLTPSHWQNDSVLVLDDCDLRSLATEEVALTREQLEQALFWSRQHPDSVYGRADALLEQLLSLWSKVPVAEPFSWHSHDLMDQLGDLVEALAVAAPVEEPNPFEGGQSWEDLERLHVPRRFFVELRDVLGYEFQAFRQDREWNPRVRLERRLHGTAPELRMTLRRELPLAALRNKPVVLLDASLSLEEAQRLFPDRKWQVIDPPLALPKGVEVVQFPDRLWGKTSLMKPAVREEALAELGRLVEKHRGERIGVITHHSFAAAVRSRFPEVQVGHYFGQRGSNEFQHCSVLICFGTPNPNPQDLLWQARGLYWDGAPLWEQDVLERRTFDMAPGQPRVQTTVRNFADPRLREMLEARRDEELRQALFRLRPLSVEETWQGLLHEPAPGTTAPVRLGATIYLYSSVPLRGLTVSLRRQAPQAQPSSETEPKSGVVLPLSPGPILSQPERETRTRKPLRGETPPAHGPPAAAVSALS